MNVAAMLEGWRRKPQVAFELGTVRIFLIIFI